ncbi:MAG TPA: adenosylhomocysteinase [Gammaproteobacteria bacterium]|nr:adenosylhomocysteinase [Gammaproteobacteria bacterium]
MDYRVKSLADAATGASKIEWAGTEMPVLKSIAARFAREKPLAGVRISACLHVTTETANLVLTLAAGGAQVRLCASNQLSTQDDVAAALVTKHAVPVFATRGESSEEYYQGIDSALAHRPHVTLDDGADLITVLHGRRSDLLADVIGGLEETTTGVMRLRAMAKDGALRYPVIAVNDAMSKHFFDNRYGTGQSTIDGLLRATNVLLAGKIVTVAGYGWCGRGIAMRARGMGARVVVTEVNALRALEAVMDGFEVLRMRDAARISNVIVTATGQRDVVTAEHFAVVKDGCLLANAGHFNVEIDVQALARFARSKSSPRPNVEEYVLRDGRRLRLLAEGRLVNLAAAEGHPAAVMDMSFANQALCAEFLAAARVRLEAGLHDVPLEIDEQVARLKLAAIGAAVDVLTPEQLAYASSWQAGT